MSEIPPLSRSTERWEAIKELFLRAIENPPDKRAEFLGENHDIAAHDDADYQEVRLLVAGHDQAVGFFDRLQNSIGVSVRQEVEFSAGDILSGRFRIVRFVASGGMGQVYEAEDLKLGGRLAIKVLRSDIAAWPGVIERFHSEIRLARAIITPNVCRVFDIAHHQRPSGEPVTFFTMEFLEGETLAQKLRREGRLSIPAARTILAGVTDGLHCAHLGGILHCDLKPGNVMLCGDRVVVTDFGLARQTSSETSGDSEGAVGTPSYVAPEQVLREPESAPTDIYSLGIVAYEMVTGQLPFRGTSVWEIERRRLEESPAAPRTICPDIPVAWERAILRCLRRQPGERFASVGDFARAIGCHEVQPSSRRVFLWASGAAITLVSMGVLWRIRVTPEGPSTATSIAINEFTADRNLAYLAEGTADRLADSLGTLPGVRVIARLATSRISRSNVGLADARSGMNAGAYTLAGDVHGSGNEVRIHLVLTEPKSGAQIWSATYTVGNGQIEAVPPLALRAIIQALHLDLNPARLTAVTARMTNSAEAYQLYLLGRFNSSKRTLEFMGESVKYLQQSVRVDNNFAAAHAALAYSLFQFGMMDRVSAADNVNLARESAARALALQADSAEAFLVQALIAHFVDWDWNTAEHGYRRAIEADPNSVLARQWYARMLTSRRRFAEADAQIEAAVSLDPFDPALRIARGINLTYSGRAREAVDQLRLLAAEDPEHTNVFPPLSCALEVIGQYREATQAAEMGVQLSNRQSFTLSQLGHIYALAGRGEEARNILAELLRQVDTGHASPAEVAMVYAGWKDTSNTLIWLEKGLVGHERGPLLLAVDPQVDFLRHNPKFKEILAKIHPGL